MTAFTSRIEFMLPFDKDNQRTLNDLVQDEASQMATATKGMDVRKNGI